MKHEKVFHKNFIYDESSPTKIRYRRNGKPAGYKQIDRRYDTYNWVLAAKDAGKCYIWGLPFLIWELRTGFKPDYNYMINYKDVNKDNLSAYNMVLGRVSLSDNRILKKTAYDNYRNVILPRDNPDYYKDPADWTDPEALSLLNKEKERREKN